MEDKRKNVSLSMPYGGMGDFLQEVVRAALHSSNPSAVIGRVAAGFSDYLTDSPDIDPDDRNMALWVQQDLENLQFRWRAAEDKLYDQAHPAIVDILPNGYLPPGTNFVPEPLVSHPCLSCEPRVIVDGETGTVHPFPPDTEVSVGDGDPSYYPPAACQEEYAPPPGGGPVEEVVCNPEILPHGNSL